MSDQVEEENEAEVEGEHFMKVPMVHYNSLMDAADLGFEVMVARRNELRAIGKRVPLYPERDSSKMADPAVGMLDGVPLRHHDIGDIERSYSERISRTADALNHRLHVKRYK